MNSKIFKLASFLYLISGLGHTIGHFFVIERVEKSFTGLSMKLMKIDLFFLPRSVHSFLCGFSLTMGVTLTAIGILNLILLKEFGQTGFPKRLLLFNSILPLVITIISVIYFPLIIILLYSLITFLFIYLFVV